MRNHIYVDNVDLAEFGVYCSGQGTFTAPEKEVTFYDIPGVNGSRPGSSERLKNIVVTYPCFIFTQFKENLTRLRSFLLSRRGLVRIADTYHDDEFRLGMALGPIDPDVNRKNDSGEFNLQFTCLPQRWLVSGEVVQTLEVEDKAFGASLTIDNPTYFDSQPLLHIFGDGGRVYVSKLNAAHPTEIVIDSELTVTDFFVDCQTMAIYSGDENLSASVGFERYDKGWLRGVDAPVLVSGQNSVGVNPGGNISKVEIMPRWWRA